MDAVGKPLKYNELGGKLQPNARLWRTAEKRSHQPCNSGSSGSFGRVGDSHRMERTISHRERVEAMNRILLNTAALILLTLVGTLHAADKSPHQILDGKPVASSSGSGIYYDGQGRFSGRSSSSGNSIQLYDSQGRSTGRVDTSKDSTRIYDRSGSFAGRSSTSGNTTIFYDSKGSLSGRSVTSGDTTRFYDSKGEYSGRAETSDGMTRYYDAAGRFVGSKK